MRIDLHTHTTASDGKLAPAALLAAAGEAGVEVLAITDHDSVGAYDGLTPPAGLRLVAGVEFSTTWHKLGIHVVGLGVGLASAALREALDFQQAARQARAARIAAKLEKRGIPDALAGAARFAGEGRIGRPHFAQYLVEIGAVPSIEFAFRKYLDGSRVGGLQDGWADLPRIVAWIREAGGIAVLAHPAKYQLTRRRLEELASEFVAAGGEALEVISGQQHIEQTRALASLASSQGLLASQGSDFHAPGQPWARLGAVTTLPAECVPVWERLVS
ncbi:MAG: PHP domain-containing protein [Gammaproteobacteria bacterium]|nr:PHP domain-containing protein [Gammaproteobacteria bacterium]